MKRIKKDKTATSLNALQGVVIEEEGQKRFLPAGTSISAEGREWVLKEQVEIQEK